VGGEGRARDFSAVLAAHEGVSGAEATVHLSEDAIEYRLRVRNPTGALISAAGLEVLDESSTPRVVAVFFSDAAFRERTLNLRGSASIPASMSAAVLGEEVQGSPSTFRVFLRVGSAGESWVGRLRPE
jgi:hypothetical protein